MSKKLKKEQSTERLLCDMFIAQLAEAGLAQQQIREIVGVDIKRVNSIAKYFKKSK